MEMYVPSWKETQVRFSANPDFSLERKNLFYFEIGMISLNHDDFAKSRRL